jgi:hypothetical protein
MPDRLGSLIACVRALRKPLQPGLEARAIDEAGNADPTPAAWNFDVETPLTESQQTMEAAAAVQFPDAANRDVQAICTGSTPIDCPGGTALPPDDGQAAFASTRTLVWAGAGTHRYDLSVTHDSQTLHPVVATVQNADCSLTWNSANGANGHWTITESLYFVTQTSRTVPGGKLIAPGDFSVSGFDDADFAFSGGFSCLPVLPSFAWFIFDPEYVVMIDAQQPLCPAIGPGYVARCPAF